MSGRIAINRSSNISSSQVSMYFYNCKDCKDSLHWVLKLECISEMPTHPSTYHYRPQRSCGQGNIFTRVCHSVHRGGLPQCMLEYPPRKEAPVPLPQEGDPPGRRHPPGKETPRKEAPPQEGDPPGIRSMSGRYASYWNAFFFAVSLLTT